MTTLNGIAESLAAAGLTDDPGRLRFTPLEGGVSSDIWRVSGGAQTVCVKRARSRLAVAATWEVPVERNHYEAEFMRLVAAEVPGFAPRLIAEDRSQGLIVLEYLNPDAWHLWKPRLMAGEVDLDVARNVGVHQGRLARATRGRPDLASRFDTSGLFHDLRLDPYLLECARRYPDLAPRLRQLSEATGARREAMVHGDVSPKNVLVSETSDAIILDAECAWYGDPAFDLAFVLNHLLLKSVHRPEAADAFRSAIVALLEGHASADVARAVPDVRARATALLPALLLGRIDGKSPVEYLTDPEKRDVVRDVARRYLNTVAAHPLEIAGALSGELDR